MANRFEMPTLMFVNDFLNTYYYIDEIISPVYVQAIGTVDLTTRSVLNINAPPTVARLADHKDDHKG